MQRVRFETCGAPATVLVLEEAEAPAPRRGEVRVRMLASPINPSDLSFIRGTYGQVASLPATPGFEGVGVVEASGGGLLGTVLTGRTVAVVNRKGGNWAEQVVVPQTQVIPLPTDLSVEQGATFFVNPATSLVLTRRVLQVPKDAWLLQSAAGSTLGRMVIRLGKTYGFRTLNIVRRPEQVDELHSLGADCVLAFTPEASSPDDLVSQIQGITGGVRYAIDAVGGEVGSAMARCLSTGGRMVVYGTLSESSLSIPPRTLICASASIEGFWLGPWMSRQSLTGKLRLARQIIRLIRHGILHTEVAEQFPLADAAVAADRAFGVGRNGKILLTINEA